MSTSISLVRRLVLALVIGASAGVPFGCALVYVFFGQEGVDRGVATALATAEQAKDIWAAFAPTAAVLMSAWGAVKAYRAWEQALRTAAEARSKEEIGNRLIPIFLIRGHRRTPEAQLRLPIFVRAAEATAQKIAGVLGYFSGGRRFEAPGLSIFLMSGGEAAVQSGELHEIVLFGFSAEEHNLFAAEVSKKLNLAAAYKAATASEEGLAHIQAIEGEEALVAVRKAQADREAKEKASAQTKAAAELAAKKATEELLLRERQEAVHSEVLRHLRALSERAPSEAASRQELQLLVAELLRQWLGNAKPTGQLARLLGMDAEQK